MFLEFGKGKVTIGAASDDKAKYLGFLNEGISREIGPIGKQESFDPEKLDVVFKFLNIEGARAVQDRINALVVDWQREIDLEKIKNL